MDVCNQVLKGNETTSRRRCTPLTWLFPMGVLWNCLGGHSRWSISVDKQTFDSYIPVTFLFMHHSFPVKFQKANHEYRWISHFDAFRSFPVSQRQATQLRCLNSQIHLRHGAFYGRQVRCWPRPGQWRTTCWAICRKSGEMWRYEEPNC